MHRQDQRRTIARRPEETLVCTGGAQRAGPSCRKLPRGRARIHQVGRQPRLVKDDALDRALCSFMTNCFGRENELGGGSGIDVSGSSIFSHCHAWHPAGSALSEKVLERSSWKIETSTPFVYVGKMFNLQGGDIQAPVLGITTHCSLLLYPEERPQRSKVGTSDNRLLLDSPWLKGIEPMLAILARRPDGRRIWTFAWSQSREFRKTTANPAMRGRLWEEVPPCVHL